MESPELLQERLYAIRTATSNPEVAELAAILKTVLDRIRTNEIHGLPVFEELEKLESQENQE